MSKLQLLIVDHERESALSLATLAQGAGAKTSYAVSGAAALAELDKRHVDAMIVDWKLPDIDGEELLDRVLRAMPHVRVIVVAREASVSSVVQAMRMGAHDFIAKPVDGEELELALASVPARRGSSKRPAISVPPAHRARLIGESEAFCASIELIQKAARGYATVLLRGESGTGKELAAREIHRLSDRKDGAFVKIHCAALPDTLLESELFGYEKGAFSGAISRKLGRVDLASAGTLFLDEIGDVKPVIQVKLLRLLQDREYERLGGTETLQADVRFVAATNCDLEAMVASREFREDLFYRLNVIPLWMPPLRARGADIELLARQFCETLGALNHRPGLRFEDGALELFAQHSWPGNVRQLQNVVERLVVLSEGSSISMAVVAAELAESPAASAAVPFSPPPPSASPSRPSSSASPSRPSPSAPSLERHRQDAEREALLEALQLARYNRTLAAQVLGVSRRTLYNRLQAHGLLEETSPRSSPPPSNPGAVHETDRERR